MMKLKKWKLKSTLYKNQLWKKLKYCIKISNESERCENTVTSNSSHSYFHSFTTITYFFLYLGVGAREGCECNTVSAGKLLRTINSEMADWEGNALNAFVVLVGHELWILLSN